MLLHETHNRAKFCGDLLKNVGDVRDRKFVLPKKWAKVHRNFFRGCYPLRASTCQISSRSVKTAWRKALQKLGIGHRKKFILSRTDTWLGLLKSRLASVREARLKRQSQKLEGTKNTALDPQCLQSWGDASHWWLRLCFRNAPVW